MNRLVVTVICIVLGAGAVTADALPITFTKIADTSSTIPNGSGTFSSFIIPPSGSFVYPALSGNNVLFLGAGSNSQAGVYLSSKGVLSMIANRSTLAPGGAQTFSNFDNLGISGTNVGFGATNFTTQLQFGLYKNVGAGLQRVADTSTRVPGGAGVFLNFSAPYFSGTSVYFAGDGGSLGSGIYTDSGGVLKRIVDTSMTPPGGSGAFQRFGSFAFSGDEMAFMASSPSMQGVYRTLNGSLVKIADRGTPTLSGSTFVEFSSVGFDGTEIAFGGSDLSHPGIYRTSATSGKSIIKIIESGDTVSGFGPLTFGSPPPFSFKKGHVVFNWNGRIFTDYGGSLESILANGDKVFGETIQLLSIGPHSFDGQSIAVAMQFTDGKSGIYLVNLPEPSLLVPGAVLLIIRLRCRPAHRARPLRVD